MVHDQNVRCFVHFFAIPAQLQLEMTKFLVDLRVGTARWLILLSVSGLRHSPLSSVPT